METEAEIGMMQPQAKGLPGLPRIAWGHQKVGERHGMDPASKLPETTNRANNLILDADLQSCDRMHFYCCKPPRLWQPIASAILGALLAVTF